MRLSKPQRPMIAVSKESWAPVATPPLTHPFPLTDWGHFGTPPCEKALRRSVAIVVTFLALVLTAGIIFFLQAWQNDVGKVYGDDSAAATVKVDGISFSISTSITVLNRVLQVSAKEGGREGGRVCRCSPSSWC